MNGKVGWVSVDAWLEALARLNRQLLLRSVVSLFRQMILFLAQQNNDSLNNFLNRINDIVERTSFVVFCLESGD